MKKEIIILIIILIVVGTGIGIWLYRKKNYQEKMVKIHACMQTCPEGGVSCYLQENYNKLNCEEERICKAECR